MTEESKNTQNKKRDHIGNVLYGIYLILVLLSMAIIVKLVCIQLFYNPEPRLRASLTPRVITREIPPARGNIYDCKGRLLAITCPSYQIAMDCTVLTKEFAKMEDREVGDSLENDWRTKARLLSDSLAKHFPGITAEKYYKDIINNRELGRKYYKIGTPVDRKEYLRIREFPLFEEGANKGGLITETNYKRKYPYESLAARTIGLRRNPDSEVKNKQVGLEGKFDYYLHGVAGKEFLRMTDYGKIHNNDSTDVRPVDGLDLYTTLNIDYQYLADKALHKNIDSENDLEGACLILMEVKTGAIRAMVNLSREMKSTGEFTERDNLAVGRAIEPGSVFKTVTLTSVLSDGYITSLDQTMPTNHGVIPGTKNKPDQHIVDYENHKHSSRISIIDGFKMSSNYVFGRLAVDNYRDNPEKLIENISTYKLADKFEFDMEEMVSPVIHNPKTYKSWSNTDLGCIGFGYTTQETALHMLMFYNALAGKGKMMKPYLVEYIGKDGEVEYERGPGVLNSSICSRAVADTVTRALIAVTEEGTGRRLKDAVCKVAGKTGTSFGLMTNAQGKKVYSDSENRRIYQGTFVGFFPAEDPQYSVICVVYSKPTKKSFQGGGIPASTIKELVDGIYKIDPYFRNRI